jgi:hypothetical protein
LTGYGHQLEFGKNFLCNVRRSQSAVDKDLKEQSEELETSVKGKEIPLQAWRDPEGSRRLRLPDFKTIGT